MRGICMVVGCERDAQCLADGMNVCLMHYKRWGRSGSFGSPTARPLRPERGVCIMADCDATDDGLHGYCKKHATRLRRHGDPSKVFPVGSPAGPDHHSRNDDGLTYGGAHQRVRTERGRAAGHACIDCGGPAAQWSYNRKDPAERVGQGGPYSIDPAFYDPRCTPCHKAFDLAAIRAERSAS